MGLRFKKSINLGGGFRINLSKSGVGYSWGIPGYRITKTANGRVRKTYSIPKTGISYVHERGINKKLKPQNSPSNNYSNQQNVLVDIDSASIEQFQSADYKDLITKISMILKANRLSNVLLLSVLLAGQPVFLIFAVTGLILKILLYTFWKINLDYELDEYSNDAYNKKCNAWISLNENKQTWQIIQSAVVTNQKINAGARRNFNRRGFKILPKAPRFMKTNIKVLEMKLRKETLILLPDKILILRGLNVGTVNYDDIKIETSSVRIIEYDTVPRDAQIIDYTWQYVNKNGSPDKRFKNNRRLPVCLYGQIFVKSRNGLNVEIQCSNIEKARIFAERIKQ